MSLESDLLPSDLLKPDNSRQGVAGWVEDFVQSAAYGAIQRPINGVVQLADHLGADWKAPELIDAPKDNNFATTTGSMAGTIVDVVLL